MGKSVFFHKEMKRLGSRNLKAGVRNWVGKADATKNLPTPKKKF